MKRIMQIVGMLLSLVVVVPAQVPSVSVSAVDKPPLIDGVLSEAMWQRAPDAKDFKVLKTSELAKEQTEVWLARDNTWLFVAFKCHDTKASSIACQVTSRNGSVNRDESVELFISAGTDGRSYHHFMMNAAGVQRDNRAEGLSRNIDWDAHWRAATAIDKAGQCWTLEAAIPLFYFQKDKGSDPWRLNMTRHHKQAPEELSAWAPVAYSFHEPEKFGTITGLESATNQTPMFAPVVVATRVGEFLDLPLRCYKVTVSARNDGGQPGRMAVTVTDRTKDAKSMVGPESIELEPGHTRELTITVPIQQFRERATEVAASYSNELGRWVWSVDVTPQYDTRPFVCCMDRSYYTKETEAQLIYGINMPAEARRGLVVKVSAPFMDKPVSVPVSGAEGRVRIPLAGVKAGAVQVEAELIGEDGSVMVRFPCELIRREPATMGNEVKSDRWNRCALLNDKPFFPIGFISISPKAYPMLAGMGMNAAIHWGKVDTNTLSAELDFAQKEGIYLVPHPVYNFAGVTYDIYRPEAEELIRKGIENDLPGYLAQVASHPATLAWFGFDEPGGEALLRVGREYYDAINRLDGYHPFFHNYCGMIPKDELWQNMADVAMVDIYWGPSLPLAVVQRGVDASVLEIWKQNEMTARIMNKPLWTVTLNESAYPFRMPLLPQEQRIHTYLDLIHGAAGLFYFAWPPHHYDLYKMLCALAGEIKTLSPALLRRSPPQKVRVEGGDADMIHVLLKDRPEGGYLLLAGNILKTPVEVRFALPGLKKGTKVRSLFEKNRVLRVTPEGFTDRLEGYGTRVYTITGMEAATQAVMEISLSLKPEPAAESARKTMSENLILNGGFEADGEWSGIKADGPAGIDTNRVFAGKRSLRLRHERDLPGVTVTSPNITLKPNTRYELSVRLRGEFESGPAAWGGPTIILLNQTTQKGGLYLQTHMKGMDADWVQRSGVYVTGPKAETAQVMLMAEAKKYIGTAWIDEVVLREAPSCETRNLLRNSSFEHATLPGWPDRWSAAFGVISPDILCGGKDAVFSQDAATAVDGKYSLRLKGFQGTSPTPGRPDRGVVLDQAKKYVFSIFMKTDTEGKNVWVGGYDMGFTKFTLTRDWKRYHIPAAPAVMNGLKTLHITVRTDYSGTADEKPEATVWLDAAQFEEGTEPTEYTRDIYAPDDPAWMQAETPN